MILAIDRDGVLYAFDTMEHVSKEVEAIDIENGEYEFVDDTGQRLMPKIVDPVTSIRKGTFRLVSSGEPDQLYLESFIDRAREIADTGAGISSIAQLRSVLKGR
jgi:hypothetical protein